MRHRVIFSIGALTIAYLYIGALVYAIGFAAAQRLPDWWRGVFSASHGGILSWVLASHAVAVVLVSLPFAWGVARLYGRFALYVGLAVSVSVWTIFEAPLLLDAARSPGFFPKGIWLADTLQFVAVLPALVWLLRTLPSNRIVRSP